MALEMVVQISLILWPLFLCSLTVAQQTRGEPMCGKVAIRCPFVMKISDNTSSINNSCIFDSSSNYNKSFLIECRDQIARLTFLDLEVTKIDITRHEITVKNKTNRCKDAGRSLDLGGSPFLYSQRNRLINFGCGSLAVLDSNTSASSGCLSYCERENEQLTEKGCSGKYCCQTKLPSNLSSFAFQSYLISLKDTDKMEVTPRCDYMFIADEAWVENMFSRDKIVKKVLDSINSSDIVLDWWIPDILNPSFPGNQNNFSCSRVNNITSGIGLSCICLKGFSGNPYVRGGCTEHDSGHQKQKLARKLVVIIGVFSSFGSISLLIVVWSLYKIIMKRKKKTLKEKYFKQNGGLLLQQKLSSSELNVDTIKVFSSKDLEKATDHFNVNRVLGKGGQGTVYKGMLVDGKIVAVKKLKVQGNVEDFINEIVILTQINHRNVVKLLGCCLETKFPLLVYEFISNGTLYDHLHDQNDAELQMTWDIRLRIATEISGALFYLHSAASQPIYHRDIKSTNILLDEKYRAKVADFGASRMVSNVEDTHLTTRVQGTLGYLDPEYYYTSQLTEKSDVFSFGVVLVELLTGEKAISSIGSDGKAKSLASHFITCLEENCLFDTLDDRVLKEGDKEHIMVVAKIAKRCLNMTGKKRPTMREVTMELEGIQNLGKGRNKLRDLDEIKTGKNDLNVPWDVECSIPVNSVLDGMASSSSEVLPLVNK